MPDFFDKASDTEQQHLRDQLEAQRLRAAAAPRLAPVGHCRNVRCGEEFPTGDSRLFCDSKCAAEHARTPNANHFNRAA